VTVDSVIKCEEEDVYDITVDDTHCIFANGILVHNCQHWAASTCQVISDFSSSARYRYGISATPWRDMDDDLLIDACFGKILSDISASTLIEKKILVQPKIYFVHTKTKVGGTYADVYRKIIVENVYRNTVIKNLAEQMMNDGRQTLILVRQIAHGEILQDMIPGSIFLHGSIASKKRQSTINKMKEGKHRCVIASSIFDEGVDVRPLSALILAGAGKSQTRALQRIGRVIRAYEGKKDAIVIDFFDDSKYLRKHSQARRKIYRTEPKFEISDIEMDTNGQDE
jgi:superfamily II DNA or RNA helicase